MAYTSRHEKQIPSSMVGCYSPRTNRCALYNIDLPNGHATSTGGDRATNWSETEATIVHEAVHQLAYNSGIHERLSMDPLWFIEGLACMFEQPGVYDSQQQSGTLVGRMDLARRHRLQAILDQPNLLLSYLKSLSESDELFEREIEVAYDLSWALTFYVAERMPAEFRKYSSRTRCALWRVSFHRAWSRLPPSVWRRPKPAGWPTNAHVAGDTLSNFGWRDRTLGIRCPNEYKMTMENAKCKVTGLLIFPGERHHVNNESRRGPRFSICISYFAFWN
ncbi:MAG: DUF1570 domain-containing protein [Pirellulaceae bacterium]